MSNIRLLPAAWRGELPDADEDDSQQQTATPDSFRRLFSHGRGGSER
jgi:hypothetical protein